MYAKDSSILQKYLCICPWPNLSRSLSSTGHISTDPRLNRIHNSSHSGGSPLKGNHGWGYISSVPLSFQIFLIIKTLVTYWIWRSHLTGVTAVELHENNTSPIRLWFKESNRYFYKAKNCGNEEINELSFTNPTLGQIPDFTLASTKLKLLARMCFWDFSQNCIQT